MALGSVVYVWNADTSSIKELCRTGFTSQYITAAKWDQSGRLLPVATNDGEIQVELCNISYHGNITRNGILPSYGIIIIVYLFSCNSSHLEC